MISVAAYLGDKLLALKRSQVVFWLALWFTALWKTAEDDDDQVVLGFI